CKGKVYPTVLEKWKKHEELVLEIIDDIRFRVDIDSPMGYVEYMLNSRLKELSETAMLKQDIQGSFSLEMDNILDAVIAKYSKSTGAVATFLVKDIAINELTKICTLEEAEEWWKKNEEFVMDSIYGYIKKNRKKRSPR
ncbi:replication initiation protein, partial [Bacillus thuringiensis]